MQGGLFPAKLTWQQAPGWPYSSLPVPAGAYRRDGEGLFTRVCSDRTRGNGSEL